MFFQFCIQIEVMCIQCVCCLHALPVAHDLFQHVHVPFVRHDPVQHVHAAHDLFRRVRVRVLFPVSWQ